MTSGDLISLYEFSYAALKRNLDGVTQEESMVMPPAGNCLNWVLGHLVTARGLVLNLAGGAPVMPEDAAQTYRRGSGQLGPNDKVLDMGTLRGLLSDSQQQLVAALEAMSDETLALPVPEQFRRPPLTGSIGDSLARLCLHEGYHNGQIGLLRRIAGKPGAIA